MKYAVLVLHHAWITHNFLVPHRWTKQDGIKVSPLFPIMTVQHPQAFIRRLMKGGKDPGLPVAGDYTDKEQYDDRVPQLFISLK